MSVVYLMRHGAIIQQRPRRFIGQTDFPLTEEGRAQAALWREPLAEVPFAAVVSSDLSRCLETASIVLAGRDIPVRRWLWLSQCERFVPRLIENVIIHP